MNLLKIRYLDPTLDPNPGEKIVKTLDIAFKSLEATFGPKVHVERRGHTIHQGAIIGQEDTLGVWRNQSESECKAPCATIALDPQIVTIPNGITGRVVGLHGDEALVQIDNSRSWYKVTSLRPDNLNLKSVLNLTASPATAEEKAIGIFDLDDQDQVSKLLSFDELPNITDICARCDALANLIPRTIETVMIAGPCWLTPRLATTLANRGFRVVFPFVKDDGDFVGFIPHNRYM